MENEYKIFVRNPKGKRPLGKLRCKWEDHVKIDQKQDNEYMNWIYLAQDRDQWQSRQSCKEFWTP
jgi:hypothetical protein